jgi:hypothetical protein
MMWARPFFPSLVWIRAQLCGKGGSAARVPPGGAMAGTDDAALQETLFRALKSGPKRRVLSSSTMATVTFQASTSSR